MDGGHAQPRMIYAYAVGLLDPISSAPPPRRLAIHTHTPYLGCSAPRQPAARRRVVLGWAAAPAPAAGRSPTPAPRTARCGSGAYYAFAVCTSIIRRSMDFYQPSTSKKSIHVPQVHRRSRGRRKTFLNLDGHAVLGLAPVLVSRWEHVPAPGPSALEYYSLPLNAV